MNLWDSILLATAILLESSSAGSLFLELIIAGSDLNLFCKVFTRRSRGCPDSVAGTIDLFSVFIISSSGPVSDSMSEMSATLLILDILYPSIITFRVFVHIKLLLLFLVLFSAVVGVLKRKYEHVTDLFDGTSVLK